ncbi:signal peptide peptidase SppA [Ulvibacterium sp.]|uniref:signal peptide peptidase SppA n=1 Tax=Ulvibacterium sp. TaxID=2665914 RepID=UPI00262720C3|nr:signal peptide peptidase SppA [Ulvibacterium sp.]
MKFLRNLLAAILGCMIAFGIIMVMFVVFLGLVSNMEEGINIKENSILELRIQRPVKDYVGKTAGDPFDGFFEQSLGLDDIVQAIEVAVKDTDIKGISIPNNFIMAGLAQTQTIRKALSKFRESGKFVYAYADFYPQKDYYLASVADSIFLNPVGKMDFKGLSTEVLYFKDFQEKTGIKMEVVRHGKYKSAVEPFLSNEMSPENRTQIHELLESLWNSMLSDISEQRDISEGDLNVIADTLGARSPEFALKSGLIDSVLYFDQYEEKLAKASGLEHPDQLNYLSLEDYIGYAKTQEISSGRDKVAVIFAQGEIIYGEGGQDLIGQGIMNEALIKARDDKSVKAIVVRVNSPGGSALVSDIIWRQIELAKMKKPVVVSMGNMATSGGYYIASGADRIFAEPTTVTGSIGVFGTVPNVGQLTDDIGINAEQVGTNTNSVGYSIFEPMGDNFRTVVRQGVEDAYNTFLDRVSKGRGISIAKADSLAQGRVWSGVDAKRLGLVDELGTLKDAVAEAATLAELDDYRLKKYPRYKSGFERFMEDMGGASAKTYESIIEREVGLETYNIIKQIRTAMKQKGIQARMPFILNIK